jgi:hypothetical protein
MGLILSQQPILGSVRLYSVDRHSFLYCCDCYCVLLPQSLTERLTRFHKGLSCVQRKQVVLCYTALTKDKNDLITRHEQIIQLLQPDYSLPLPFLPTYSGFACAFNNCRFLSQSYKLLRVHLNNTHVLSGAACAPYMQPVSLQSWCSRNRKCAKYWIVEDEKGIGQLEKEDLHSTHDL